MVTLFEILILAVIQGVTEWLPISSSAHLVIAQEYLGLDLPVLFDVLLHLGSLLVVLTMFWKDVCRIFESVLRLDFKSQNGKLGLHVILGSIATAAVGFLFRDEFESYFHNLFAVGVALIATGCFYCFLYVSRQDKRQGRSLRSLDAIVVGLAQGVALIPGVSRSGLTIATGLLLRVEKEVAFRFSFLLFIPAVIGAAALSVMGSDGLRVAVVDPVSSLVGLAVVVAVGYVSLRLLHRVVIKGKLHWFACYCWAIGLMILVSQFLHL